MGLVDTMKIHFLKSGYLESQYNHVIADNSRTEKISIPVPFYLIEHPAGNVLIDGGNAFEVAEDPVGHWGDAANHFKVKMQKADFVLEQLKRLNIKPESIRYVIQTHLHIDHSGALGMFPDAEFIVQRKELEYSMNPDLFQKAIYCRKDLERQTENYFLLNGFKDNNFDLYGDGRIVILFMPGHTIGHQSVMLNLPKNGRLLVAGDAAHLRRTIDEGVIPAAGLYYSGEDYAASLNKIRFYKKQGVLIHVGHDPGEFKDTKYLE